MTRFAGWHRARGNDSRGEASASVMVFDEGGATIGTIHNAHGSGHSAASVRFETPDELRAFALKILAAAEVMEQSS